jgi:hypothetical protein
VAEHHVTVLAAKHTSQANQRAQAGAVEEIHLLQIQHHLLGIEGEFLDFDLEGQHFVACDDAAVASYNRNVSVSRVL